MEKIVSALTNLGISSEWRPISDIALKNTSQKISGNAQKRGKNFILHHGTILYDFSLLLIEKYLKIPKNYPDYRKNRSHGEFVSNVQSNAENIKCAIAEQFLISLEEKALSPDEKHCLKEFCKKRSKCVL